MAEGTYKPTGGADRAATFQLKNGVALYGGFAGAEISRDQRDWEVNVTVLSGDIGVEGEASDNSYHVVTGSGTDATAVFDGFTVTGGHANGENYPHDCGGGMYNDGGSPTLTNVTFIGNSANAGGGGMSNGSGSATLMNVTFISNSVSGTSLGWEGGGGMGNEGSSPTLTNVTFIRNSSTHNGGGLFNLNGNPTLTNVTFSGNSVNSGSEIWDGGGGMSNFYSHPMLTNVTFSGNSSNQNGGGMLNSTSNPTLANVTFSGNSADQNGGGMVNLESNPTVANSILWGNTAFSGTQIYNYTSTLTVAYSLVQGGYPGTGNISGDPQFIHDPGPGADGVWGTADDDYGDLRLQPTSPAVDAGDNTAVPPDTADLDGDGDTAEPIPFDLAGAPRFADVLSRPDTGNGSPPIVDMGAYETVPGLALIKTANDNTPNPGQRITCTLTIINSSLISATNALISDTLPGGLTFAGPVTLDPPQPGATLAQDAGDLPTLASGLTITAGVRITVTLPVTVETGLAGGTVITNTAAVTSSQVVTPQKGAVSITVANAPPVAVDDSADTDEDTAVVIGVLANDSDANGDILSVRAIGAPNYGSVPIISIMAVVYTPANRTVSYSDVFTYSVSDSILTDTASVTVTADNDTPLFTSTPVTVAIENVPYTYPITATDVDTDDVLTITAPTLPAWLTLADHGDGTAALSGVPTGAEVGDHGVVLQVRDTAGLTDTQSFTITVAGRLLDEHLNHIYLPLILRSSSKTN